MTTSRLCPLALGLSLGILWGVSVFFMGIIAHFFSYGEVFVTSMGTLYLGYEATLLGSLIGGVIGFVDALIWGLIIAWLYNFFARHTCKR